MATLEFSSIGSKNPEVDPIRFDPDLSLWDDNDAFLVRHLIEKLVYESVRNFQMQKLAIFTEAVIHQGRQRGKFGSPHEDAPRVNLELAQAAAIQAFEDGLYLIFVDGKQKKSVDDVVTLKIDSQIKLIRLTALAGGW